MASLDAALGKTMAKAGLTVCPSNPDRGRGCRRTATVEWEKPTDSFVLARFLDANRFSPRPAVLFQRQEQLRDRLMLRYLREEAQPLAIDREVACFLAAGRKPVAIKVE